MKEILSVAPWLEFWNTITAHLFERPSRTAQSELGARIQPQGGLLINSNWKEVYFLLQESWNFGFSLYMVTLCICTSVAIELQHMETWATDHANRQ